MYTPTRPSAIKRARNERVRLILRDVVIVAGCLLYLAVISAGLFIGFGSVL